MNLYTKNKTKQTTKDNIWKYKKKLYTFSGFLDIKKCVGKTFNQDFFDAMPFFPKQSVDLLILDPPFYDYKNYKGFRFNQEREIKYQNWFDSILTLLKPKLKKKASIYICLNWKRSIALAPIIQKYFIIQNRITYEEETGRGAKNNWKNNSFDIWFCTMGVKYYFNAEAVQIKREKRTRYDECNARFMFSPPSNLWTDIAKPFWAMEENTKHPLQKSEKVIAKLILASTKERQIILDPFLGSGTTSVVAKKLKRRYVGIEINTENCCIAEQRLEDAQTNPHIYGYIHKIFWDKNCMQKYKNAF